MNINLKIQFQEKDGIPVDRNKAMHLIKRIKQFDVEDVKQFKVRNDEDGTMGADLSVEGTILLALTTAAIPQVFSFFKDWILRKKDRTLEIEVGQENGKYIKASFPEGTDPDTINRWIDLVKNNMDEKDNS